jgi:hypothetical protein
MARTRPFEPAFDATNSEFPSKFLTSLLEAKLAEESAKRDLKIARLRLKKLEEYQLGLRNIQLEHRSALAHIQMHHDFRSPHGGGRGGGSPRGRGNGRRGRGSTKTVRGTPSVIIYRGTKRKHDFGERGYRQPSDRERGDEPRSVPVGDVGRQHEEGSSGTPAADDTGVTLEPRARTLRPPTKPDSGGVVQLNVLSSSGDQTQDS